MGLIQSPRIVTDGLTFAVDPVNDKSYKGPAVQNVLTSISPITWNQTGLVFTPTTENVFIPSLGTVTSQKTTGFNNYPAVSAGCCPNLYTYGTSLPVDSSTQYTYAILYKTTSGYTHPNFMYRYEYGPAPTYSYLTEAGIHNTTNRIHLGDGWYWAWGTFTTQATATILNAYSFYYKYGTETDTMYVAKILLVKGNYTQLHPKYWPDVNTTRGTSSVLFDLTNQNTITATDLTYNNDGTFGFDGVNDFALTSSDTIYGNNTSWEAWVNCEASVSGFNMFMGRYLPYFSFRLGDRLLFSNSISGTQRTISTAANLSLNTWYHATFTTSYDGANTTMKIYTNSVETATGTFAGTQDNYSLRFMIGDGNNFANNTWYPFKGKISNVKVYNRTLTAAEILQNFNALRGRFGI